MNETMQELCRFRIITSELLVDPGPVVTVKRSWKERLFGPNPVTDPWEPWIKTKQVQGPPVPSEKVFMMQDRRTVVMHPSMVLSFKKKMLERI